MENQYPAVPGIYKISWPDVSEYFYYGQSVNMLSRRAQHLRKLRANKHENKKLQSVFNKHGVPEFEVVEVCEKAKLNEKESRLIDLFYNWGGCCNLSKSSSSASGWNLSEVQKKIISDHRKGRKATSQTRLLISEGLKRAYRMNRRTTKDTSGVNNNFYGKKHTEETKLKMRTISKNRGANNAKAKLVLDLSTGIFYDYAGEAAIAKNINPQELRSQLNGHKRNRTSFIYV